MYKRHILCLFGSNTARLLRDIYVRWTYHFQVESIMLSIISMLSSPNDESPANLDAAKQFRDSPDDFKRMTARIVRKSQEMLWHAAAIEII